MQGMIARDLHSGRCEEILELAVNTFCTTTGRHPSEVIASPKHLRRLMRDANWQVAGLSKKHWGNVLSRLRAALAHFGIDIDRRVQFALDPVWQAFLAAVPERKRQDLGGFARWCSARQIRPEAVTQQHWEEYLVYCNECMMREEPRNHWSTAMRAWNWIAKQFPDKRLPIIPNPGTDQWRGIPWEDTPARLKEEMELLRQWQLAGNLDEFDELDEDEALENEIYEQKPMSPKSVKAYHYDLHAHFSHLAQSGVPKDQLGSLAALVDAENVKRAKRHQLERKGLRKPDRKLCYRLRCQISAVISAARYLKVPREQLLRLEKLRKTVRPPKGTMSPKVQSRLAQFSRDEVEADYLNLPYRVARELQKVDQPNKLDALEMQSAAALALMHDWPARISNIAQLDFNIHIKRPPGGQPGSWYIHIPADDVKNEVELNVELPPECSALLELYRMKFRPILLGESACSRLFINQFGKVKSGQLLAVQLKRFVKRRLGLEWNAHLVRAFAGQILLDEHPGHYADVQKVLAHKNIKTTMSAYVTSETKASFKIYNDVIDRRRGTSHLTSENGAQRRKDIRRGRGPVSD